MNSNSEKLSEPRPLTDELLQLLNYRPDPNTAARRRQERFAPTMFEALSLIARIQSPQEAREIARVTLGIVSGSVRTE